MLPAPRYPLCLRSGKQNLHISAAGFELLGRPAAASLCFPLPAIPCAFVSGSKIFTFPPPDLSFSGARRAASLCSPLPASPCAFVSGSKIFTFPPPDLSFSRARRPPLFAPPSPLSLVPSFRGAKSSHFSRRFSPSPAPGGGDFGLPVALVVPGNQKSDARKASSAFRASLSVSYFSAMSSIRRCFPSTDSNTRISQLWGFGRQQMPFFRSIMYPVRARMIPPWQDTSTLS